MRSRPRAGHRVLVLVEGAGHGALAAVRELWRHGWDVGVAGGREDGIDVVGRSRAVRRRHLVPDVQREPSAAVDVLGELVRAEGYELVLGTGDAWLAALPDAAPRIGAVVGHPRAEIVRRSLDKLAVQQLASAVGLAVPRSEVATEGALVAWSGPAVVKPRAHGGAGTAGRVDARHVHDAAALREAVRAVHATGAEAVLQEPVLGDLGGLVGLMVAGRLVQVVQQRASRVWPAPAGVTARALTVDPDDELVSRTEELLATLGWEGPVQLEFLHPPTGPPVVIDLNGRVHGSLALAQAAGLTPIASWVAHLLEGVPPEPRRGVPGVRYRWLEGDLRAARVDPRFADGRRRTRSPRPVDRVGPLWDVGDPAPAVVSTTALARRVARRVIRPDR